MKRSHFTRRLRRQAHSTDRSRPSGSLDRQGGRRPQDYVSPFLGALSGEDARIVKCFAWWGAVLRFRRSCDGQSRPVPGSRSIRAFETS